MSEKYCEEYAREKTYGIPEHPSDPGVFLSNGFNGRLLSSYIKLATQP
jgi:hypothetical protein